MNMTWILRIAVCGAGLLIGEEALAQYPIGTSRGIGPATSQLSSPFQRQQVGSVGRTGGSRGFGAAGSRSVGGRGVGGGLGSRNRPQPNSSPALSNYLNLIPGAADSFGGQYFLRTQPFNQAAAERGNLQSEIGALQDSLSDAQSGLSALAATPVAPISSGLSTTGHPVGFLSTGSYFPGR